MTIDVDRGLLAQAHELLVSRVGHGHAEDPQRPETVQAMQIALNVPKSDPPARTSLLEASARAVVAVCLDGRAVTDAQWRDGLTDWYDHLIRKIARRGRNKQWDDVQGLPGVTVDVEGAQARAFVPSPVEDVPRDLGKLQIKGTELEKDPRGSAPADPATALIALNAELEMSTGKAAAQVGHGSMLLAAAMTLEEVHAWAQTGFELQVRELPGEKFRELAARDDAVLVRDAGFTEVAPDSVTVVALPPATA